VSLQAPFPWFGGKRTVAGDIWARLGDPVNYVEPFFGSGAVLLNRQKAGKTESINDACRYVSNFWRAVQHDPEAVAHHLDWPVNECDLTARHLWLLNQGAAIIAACDGDPDFYDAKVAGFWAWGACSWIGSGWCSGEGPWSWDDEAGEWCKRPHLGDAGRGINRQSPHLGNAGMGISRQRPHLGNAGMGINRKRPHLGDAGRGEHLIAWMSDLAERLRNVRVCCGDWERVCGQSVTHGHGMTGIFLDPPYADTAGRTEGLYATDSLTVAHDAREWAIAEGRNPMMRIAFAGYEGEHVFPSDWDCVAWKTKGGFGNQGDDKGRANAGRERLWYSPACLPRVSNDLFAGLELT
jgi:hypothetical protein